MGESKSARRKDSSGCTESSGAGSKKLRTASIEYHNPLYFHAPPLPRSLPLAGSLAGLGTHSAFHSQPCLARPSDAVQAVLDREWVWCVRAARNMKQQRARAVLSNVVGQVLCIKTTSEEALYRETTSTCLSWFWELFFALSPSSTPPTPAQAASTSRNTSSRWLAGSSAAPSPNDAPTPNEAADI